MMYLPYGYHRASGQLIGDAMFGLGSFFYNIWFGWRKSKIVVPVNDHELEEIITIE